MQSRLSKCFFASYRIMSTRDHESLSLSYHYRFSSYQQLFSTFALQLSVFYWMNISYFIYNFVRLYITSKKVIMQIFLNFQLMYFFDHSLWMTCFQVCFYSLISFNSIAYSFNSIFHLSSIFLTRSLFNIFMKYFSKIFIILYNESFSFAIVLKVYSYFLSYFSIKISQWIWAMKLFNNLMFSFLLMNVHILHLFFINNILIIFHVDSFSSFIFITIWSMILNHFFNSFSNDTCI